MVSWEYCYLEGSEGASKERAYVAKKCLKIQRKDNSDTQWKIYKHSFMEITFGVEPEK